MDQKGREIVPYDTILGKHEQFQMNGKSETARQGGIDQIVEAASALCEEGRDDMNEKVFLFWIEALKNDQSNVVREILEKSPPGGRSVLLNGTFIYSKYCDQYLKYSVQACSNIIEGTKWFHPLTLLVSCRAIKSLRVVLEGPYRGTTDVFLRDDRKANIIHALILSSKSTKMEDEYIEIYNYIMSTSDLETKKGLLFQENSSGLRPLELSVTSAQFGICQAIFDEVGVYRHNKGHLGMRTEVWYDVTEYECWLHPSSRRWKSPLDLLSFVTNADVETPNARKFFSWTVFCTWNYIKFRQSLPFLILWFLWRVLVTITTYFVHPIMFYGNVDDTENITGSCNKVYIASLPASITIVVYAALVILLDLFEWIQYIRRDYVLMHEAMLLKDYATQHGNYRFCVCFVMFSIILRAFLGKGNVAAYNTSWILGTLYTLSAIFNVWNLLYFLEMLPWFSIVALSIQRMFAKMLRFLTVFSLLFFSFEYTFFRLYNDRGVCAEGFTGWVDSFYSTFLIMVNMVNLAEVVGGIDILLVVIHVIYIFVVAILLLNFLIALMSDAMTKVMNKADILVHLQQLSAALLIEARIGRLFNNLFSRRQRQYFKSEDDRLYLVCQV